MTKYFVLIIAAVLLFLLYQSIDAGSINIAQETQAGEWQFGGKEKVGTVTSALIDESSGLVASQNFAGHFWTHNDGGSTKGLFLLDGTGKLRATVNLPEAIPFRDWEDMAAATIDGVNYLFVGDVGDNLAKYPTCRVYVFKEPQGKLEDEATKVAEWSMTDVATIEFKYEDGPRDCESMMVDVPGERIFFVSKRGMLGKPTTLHWLPLQTESTATPLVAAALPFASNQPMLTGMSLSFDGRLAVIRGYQMVWLFEREATQSWTERFAAEADFAAALPIQRQGEAIAFSPDNKAVYLSSEGIGRPLWKIALKQELANESGK